MLIYSKASILAFGASTNDASQIVQDGATTAGAISQAMNGLWDDVLNGGLYDATVKLGVFFAVGTLTLFMVQFFKNLMDGDDPKAFTEIIWPLIVIVLLANQGAVLKNSTLQLRAIINNTNQQLLTSTSANIQLEEAYQQIMNQDSAAGQAQAVLSQCSRIADPQQQQDCVQNATQQAQQIANSIPNGNNQNSGVLDAFKLPNPLEDVQNVISLFIRGFLISIGIAFQYVVEISLLLTGLLGPLAVGASLLPVGQKSIYAWLIAFYSVGMVKLCYNIITGLVATMILKAGANDPLIFACITGILAPVLAMVLAAGGGMAVFSSLSSLATTAITGGIDIAVMRSAGAAASSSSGSGAQAEESAASSSESE